MPASTRSSSKQVRLDDSSKLDAPIKSSKRKADDSAKPPAKRSAKTEPSTEQSVDSSGSVTINRAPVLELWAASVASFQHPKLSWQTCLSVGGAISTLCAISKGRAIGSIDKPDPDEAKQKQEERRHKAAQEHSNDIAVMHFNLSLKDGNALVSGKPRRPNESALKHKFGDHFDDVREAFKKALKTWQGSEDDLDSKAFHMYEKFRPTVPAGQKGWGRQGQLSFEKIAQVVAKPGS